MNVKNMDWLHVWQKSLGIQCLEIFLTCIFMKITIFYEKQVHKYTHNTCFTDKALIKELSVSRWQTDRYGYKQLLTSSPAAWRLSVNFFVMQWSDWQSLWGSFDRLCFFPTIKPILYFMLWWYCECHLPYYWNSSGNQTQLKHFNQHSLHAFTIITRYSADTSSNPDAA